MIAIVTKSVMKIANVIVTKKLTVLVIKNVMITVPADARKNSALEKLNATAINKGT